MKLQNVLVADDHEITRRGIREILHDAFPKLTVFEVPDGDSVIEQLSARPWDLIILDILMPGASALDVIARVRAARPNVPILMLTALPEVEYVVQTLKAGANGFIHKHRAADDLLTAIKEVAAGGQYLHPTTAIEIATSLTQKQSAPHEKLSNREMEIFLSIARGRAVKEIAGDLGLSDKTVATYLGRIREKIGLTSHVEIARYALQHHLVD